MVRMKWQGAGSHGRVAVAACLLWLVCGPLSAAPAAASAPAPASGAASAASPAPSQAERLRRCQQHPVRAVREECLRQLRRDTGPR